MSLSVLLLTAEPEPAAVLPALSLLPHQVRVVHPEVSALLEAQPHDVVIVDARADLAEVRTLCRLLDSTGGNTPLIAVFAEGNLVVLNAGWHVDDIMLPTAGPAEIDARLRFALVKRGSIVAEASDQIQLGELTIDEPTYTARLRGRPLDLTYKEFELLKYLAQHAGRVFTRTQLLQEVWGYDFFGGTRTVDVHIRRLRAKLGSEYEALIGTVRNVGYKMIQPTQSGSRRKPDEVVVNSAARH